MTRETKVGLLVGMGVILLIGIIVSDHLAVVQQQEPADFTRFADQAQESIAPMDRTVEAPAYPGDSRPTTGYPPAAPRRQPVPTPQELEAQRWRAAEPSDAPAYLPEQPPMAMGLDGAPQTPAQRPGYPAEQPRQAPQAPAYPPAVREVPTLTFDGQPVNAIDRELAQADQPITPTAPSVPTPQAAAPDVPPQRATGAEIVHYVKKGETLYDIALKYYGNGEYWRSIAAQNEGKVLPNGHVNENVRLVIPNRSGLALGDDFVPAGSERAVRVDVVVNDGRRWIEVKPGDTLIGLAGRHLGSEGRWKQLLDANRDQMDSPTDLRAGMTLVLPAADAAAGSSERAAAPREATRTASSKTYTVRPGDTLTRIAERVLGDGSRWKDIYQANRDKLKSPDSVVVGQELRLPS